MTEQKTLTPQVAKGASALVPTNTRLLLIARRFHWQPETLVRRVEAALPSRVEQQLYLTIASSVRIQPDSLAKILREILGTRELSERDLTSTEVGRNLKTSFFTEVAGTVQDTLWLVGRFSSAYPGVSISMMSAARLAKAYGPDHVDDVLDSIDVALNQLSETFGIGRRFSWERAMGTAIYFMTHHIMPWCNERDIPYPLDMVEFLDDYKELGRQLKSAIKEGLSDE